MSLPSGCGRQPARVSELPPHTEIFLFVSEHWRWPSRGHLADGKRHLPRPVRRLVLLRADARLGPCRRHVCDMTPDPAGRDTLPDHPAFFKKQKAGGFGRVSLPSGCGRQPARVSELPPHTEVFCLCQNTDSSEPGSPRGQKTTPPTTFPPTGATFALTRDWGHAGGNVAAAGECFALTRDWGHAGGMSAT